MSLIYEIGGSNSIQYLLGWDNV